MRHREWLNLSSIPSDQGQLYIVLIHKTELLASMSSKADSEVSVKSSTIIVAVVVPSVFVAVVIALLAAYVFHVIIISIIIIQE
jgi:hypothetical protein